MDPSYQSHVSVPPAPDDGETAPILEYCNEPAAENYKLAAEVWSYRLIGLGRSPAPDLLEMANRFLRSFAFVHWSEYILHSGGDEFDIALQVRARLRKWHADLDDELKPLLSLDGYLETAYLSLSRHYETNLGDKLLQWCCLYQLAAGYYNMLAQHAKAEPILQQVVIGFIALRGEEDPLTLRAYGARAIKFFKEGDMQHAHEEYSLLWEKQQRVLPSEHPDPYRSLQLAALSSYYMTDYVNSERQQRKAYAGLTERLGAESFDVMCSRLYLGFALTGLCRDSEALEHFAAVYKFRSDTHGRDNALALMALVAQGQAQRMMGDLEAATTSLTQAWESRLRLWEADHYVVVDTAIHLLMVYHDRGLLQEADKLISALPLPSIRAKIFDRYCQIIHTHAMMQYDAKGLSPIAPLQALLQEAREAQAHNRLLGPAFACDDATE